MRILLAFDKFKDALPAAGACAVAADTLRTLHPDWSFDLCPLSDGGDGFAEILTSAARGNLEYREVSGPRGQPVRAGFGLVSLGNIPASARTRLVVSPSVDREAVVAVIEMAQASGLALLPPGERDPWQTSTRGTGQLIRAAAELQVAAVLLGVGGSATIDLGLGALAALGLEFPDSKGEAIQPPIPSRWREVARISGTLLRPLPPIAIACDVTAPLLGPRGAAAVFGQQKGLLSSDRSRLDHESARLALMLCTHCGKSDALIDAPGAGAAGGLPFGLMVAAGATILPGVDLVASWLDLDRRISEADIVITGEGRFDSTSVTGKGPGSVVERARAVGKPVHVFAGAVDATAPNGCTLHAITPADVSLPDALRATETNLAAALQSAFRS